MTPEQFCNKHDPCDSFRNWALSTGCKTMMGVWEHPDLKPERAIWIATRKGVMSDRDLRLFAVWCCRQVQHLMADPRSVAAVDVAERFANGEATEGELWFASAAARDATWAAARASSAAAWAASASIDAAWATRVASAAASAAARAAASDASDATWAASATAIDAAWATRVASVAASDAWASSDAWAAANDAARDAQHAHLKTYPVNLD